MASRTLPSILEVKPATPKSTVSFYDKSSNTPSKILEYARKGYIVKSITSVDSSYWSIVVMEKY